MTHTATVRLFRGFHYMISQQHDCYIRIKSRSPLRLNALRLRVSEEPTLTYILTPTPIDMDPYQVVFIQLGIASLILQMIET